MDWYDGCSYLTGIVLIVCAVVDLTGTGSRLDLYR